MRRVYVLVFDKPGKSLSGWHYDKLREFDVERVQQSVIRIKDMKTAVEFAKMLHEFSVEDVKIFRAFDVTNRIEDYVGA